jgi:hypothetical protein
MVADKVTTEYFTQAAALLERRGWRSSFSNAIRPLTLDWALSFAIYRDLGPEQVKAFKPIHDAAVNVLAEAAGVENSDQLSMLNDCQLPHEGKNWALSVLHRARKMVKR